jgi:Toprim domain-containing protein
MEYMNFERQTIKHLQFLRQVGMEVDSLKINPQEFIRVGTTGELGRGEYAYKTVSRVLRNGMIGLLTWCRSEGGAVTTYKTCGWPCHHAEMDRFFSEAEFRIEFQPMMEKNIHLSADPEKIKKFWDLSSRHGRSDYLERKGVGSYRIRFRDNQYGRVAVVPIANVNDKLCGYQILNSNGSKVFAKGMQLRGAFHRLTKLADDSAIGIAESYVTAATCLELVNMPMVTAFTSSNLEHVVIALQKRYPKSPVVIFADNDMHLAENKGLISALKALEHSKRGGLVLAPECQPYSKGRDHSDWNDLVRERGRIGALEQLVKGLEAAQDDKIKKLHISISELLNF